MFRFRCPNCEAILQASEAQSGKRVKCSHCDQPLVVPSPPDSGNRQPTTIICICGGCKSMVHVPIESVGRQVPCSNCARTIDIPAEDSVVSPGNTMKFTCNNCGQQYCVLAKYAGKKFKCLSCSHSTTVSIPEAIPEPEEEIYEAPELVEEEESLELIDDEPEYEAPPAPAMEYEPEPAIDLSSVRPKRSVKPSPRASRGGRSGEEGGSALSKFILPLVMSAVVIVIGVALMAVMSGPPEDISDQAIEYAQNVIHLLHDENFDELRWEFWDLDFPFEGHPEQGHDVYPLIAAIKKGDIQSIDSTIEHTNIQHGASCYVVHNEVHYASYSDVHVNLSAVYSDDYFYTHRIFIASPQGNVQASYGETEIAGLMTSADLFVEEFSYSMSTFCTIGIALGVLYSITISSMMIVFKRYGYPGWGVFIPFYGQYLVRSVANEKGGMFGFGLWLAPFIFFPILAYFSEDV